MKIRNSRMFAYPILSEMYDDYKNSTFKINVTAKKNSKKMKVTIIPVINCPAMIDLLNKDYAEVVVHFECGRTRYRKIQKLGLQGNDFEFYGGDLNENLQVVAFIVAKKDITNYRSRDFNEDYGDLSFNIEKGSMIGISNQLDIPVPKNIYDLSSVDSIVSIVTNDEEKESMTIDLSDTKIWVKLPSEIFIGYSGMGKTVSKYTPILHSMFVIPALTYALDYLKNTEWMDVEKNLWFIVIKKKCEEKYGIFDKNLIETKTSIKIAQELIDSPIGEAVTNLLGMEDK